MPWPDAEAERDVEQPILPRREPQQNRNEKPADLPRQ
jgi:hypothetical protein